MDGIVLDKDVVGNVQFATVITHEAGHYLDLYHTFEGGDLTTCDPDIICNSQGDKCCDTKPHKLIISGCDENVINDCTTEPLGDLVHNHMSYFPPNCHYLFTDDQILLMRTALIMCRASLIESLGCVPACNDVTPDFVPSDVTVETGEMLSFSNTTIPSQATYVWTIEDQEFTSFNLTNYTFHHLGPVLVCLRATYNGCTNEHCELIQVVGFDDCTNPVLPECELLYNGMFDRNNVQIGVEDHFSSNQNPNNNKVCNWINKWKTPFFCSNLGKDAFGLYTSSSDTEESIVTVMEVPFVAGKNYKVTFEYYVGNAANTLLLLTEPTLKIGLTHSTNQGDNDDYVIKELSGLRYDNYDVSNPECLNPNTNFHYYEFTFPYTNEMGKYLYFQNFNTGPIDHSIIYIRDVHIPTCASCTPVPDFEFEIEDCSASFEGQSIGDLSLYYHWDFGDGITSSGENVTHEYLFAGTFDVCLTIACAPEISATECKEIVITGPCSDCTELPSVLATICNEEENAQNAYMANFSVLIPDGFQVCPGNDLYLYSEDVIFTVISYEIIDAGSINDKLNVGLVITSPLGYNFSQLGAEGYFILCNPLGEQFCYSIEFNGKECDNCITAEIPSIATCNESLSDVSTFVYEGTIVVDVTDFELLFTNFESTELGFQVLSSIQSGSVWTIQYRITVENLYFASTNIILYFEKPGVKLCANSVIIITEPCSELPSDCVEEWDIKPLLCSKERDNYVEFNFDMSVPHNGYILCEGGLFGTIDGGGIVEVLNAQIQGTKLNFSLNILMPSNYNPNQIYYLRLYLCNSRGEMVCYLFPFQLVCNLGSFQEPIEIRSAEVGFNSNLFSIIPNPAQTTMTIHYPDFDPNSVIDLEVIDIAGQKILHELLLSNISVVDVSMVTDGVYFVRLRKNGIAVSTQKVVVMH